KGFPPELPRSMQEFPVNRANSSVHNLRRFPFHPFGAPQPSLRGSLAAVYHGRPLATAAEAAAARPAGHPLDGPPRLGGRPPLHRLAHLPPVRRSVHRPPRPPARAGDHPHGGDGHPGERAGGTRPGGDGHRPGGAGRPGARPGLLGRLVPDRLRRPLGLDLGGVRGPRADPLTAPVAPQSLRPPSPPTRPATQSPIPFITLDSGGGGPPGGAPRAHRPPGGGGPRPGTCPGYPNGERPARRRPTPPPGRTSGPGGWGVHSAAPFPGT